MSLDPPRHERLHHTNWRRIRAQALHISHEHRRYLHEYGRLPNCPLHRLETAPLWTYLRATETETDPAWDDTTNPNLAALSDDYVARRVGLTRMGVASMKGRGSLTRDAADRIAHELGVHPLTIWEDYLFDVSGDYDDEETAA